MPRVEVVAQAVTQKIEAHQYQGKQRRRNQERKGRPLHLVDASIDERAK